MQNSDKFIGVLLAAGKGTRMGGLSDSYPKPMLPIANKPLLVHQVEMLASLGITEIVVLIGYKGYQIAHALGDGSRFGVQLRYVEQTKMLGIAHAVGQLEATIDRSFLLLLGDIYFVPKNLELMFRIFEEQQGGAVLATKQEKDPAAIMRNFSVIENEDGRVTRVIEKPRHVINNVKGVGLYLFDLSIFDAIRRTPRTAIRDEYEITEAIQVLIDDGAIVRTAEAVHDDINLTFPHDLLSLNLSIARAQPDGNLIHADAIVHPDSKVRNSVLGAGARLTSPATISNCLLFDDAVVTSPGGLSNAIVTPEMTIGCQPELDGT